MIIEMVEISDGYYVPIMMVNRHGIVKVNSADIIACFDDKRTDYPDSSFKDHEFWV